MAGPNPEVLYQVDGHVGRITLNRPHRANTVTNAVIAGLHQTLEAARADRAVWLVTVTGAGDRVFCGGADIAVFADPQGEAALTAQSMEWWRGIARFEKPLLAAVNGHALGGGAELIAMADLAIARDDVQIGFPEVGLGIFPGGGGSQLLPRLIGPRRAKELIFTGRRITPREAVEIGLLNLAVPWAEFPAAVRKLETELLANAPLALQAAKRAIDFGSEVDLATGFAVEDLATRMVFQTADRAEGVRAFFEKRRPIFKGE